MFREIRIKEVSDEGVSRMPKTKAELDAINDDLTEMLRALGLDGTAKIIDISEDKES